MLALFALVAIAQPPRDDFRLQEAWIHCAFEAERRSSDHYSVDISADFALAGCHEEEEAYRNASVARLHAIVPDPRADALAARLHEIVRQDLRQDLIEDIQARRRGQ